MNRKIEEEKIVNKCKDIFDKSLNEVDQQSLDRLTAARRSALDAIPTSNSNNNKWILTGSLASACLLLAVVLFYPSNNTPPIEDNTLLMVEVITSEDLEAMEHDAEFYDWLESEGII